MSQRRESGTPTAKRSAARLVRSQVPRAYTPGPTPRRNAKVLDAGARIEAKLERLINSSKVGVLCWRLPGVRISRISGVTYIPDAGARVPELEGLVRSQEPQIKGRPSYNVLVEFKSQTTTGSAEKKISAAVEDMAHACDELGVVGAVILYTPVLTPLQIETYKRLGRLHSVVVLEDTELAEGNLVEQLVRVARERRRLARRVGPRGGYRPTKRPSLCEQGLAYRMTVRRTNNKTLTTFGSSVGS